jgi:site-specific recombinase XerD
LRFAEEISSATGSPCRYVPIIDKFNCPRQQKGNSIRVPRSKEFFQKLFSFARERIHRARKPFVAARDFVILVLLYKTGARSIAVRHLTPPDLHFHMGLYGTINARSDKGSNGSGFRSSMLDMSSTLRDVLKWYLDTFHCVYYSENDPLFPTESGCFMSENAFRMRILKIQKELKVQKAITPHDFRRAFASHHFEDGFPLDYIQRQCNHKYQTTTEGYIVTSHSYKVRQSGKVAALLFKEAEEKNYGKKNDPVPPMPARE